MKAQWCNGSAAKLQSQVKKALITKQKSHNLAKNKMKLKPNT